MFCVRNPGTGSLSDPACGDYTPANNDPACGDYTPANSAPASGCLTLAVTYRGDVYFVPVLYPFFVIAHVGML
ncbi:hypothetical protein SLEP1_g34421 [Rubroshorea leprosula]|uniref:Uncharacterized protein n=1 Tax=Rubroshorea leprosula TaxID=152421 RepID=A0AAV5KJT3_9ROSI|nr:hypothetical protein SLEP1_g34421 [Rubroshorea leprosula]